MGYGDMKFLLIFAYVVCANLGQCIEICKEDKWYCTDHRQIDKCQPCDPYYLSPTVAKEFLNFINKLVCITQVVQKQCMKGCIAPQTYCNIMYKPIPKSNYDVSLKIDFSVKKLNYKHTQYFGAFGICEKVWRYPHCLFEAKFGAGRNFESLHMCINVCASKNCNPIKRSACQSTYIIPMKPKIGIQNIIGLVLTMNMDTLNVYICVSIAARQKVEEVNCIAQIDLSRLHEAGANPLTKNLHFLIHHYDNTYFTFNSNYISIHSIYIYEDDLAHRLKLPDVAKIIRRVNTHAQDLSRMGLSTCRSRNKESCGLPSKCIGLQQQRCKLATSNQNTASTFLSKSPHLLFQNISIHLLRSIIVAINGSKGSFNILSKDHEIMESVVVKDVSNDNNKKIIIHFKGFQHRVNFLNSKHVIFSILINISVNNGDNQIGVRRNCIYEQLPTVYFANEQSLINLGTLSSTPKNWSGLFIDGFEEILRVEDTYTKCASAETSETIFIPVIILVISLVIIGIVSTLFYKYKLKKRTCASLLNMSCISRILASIDGTGDIYDIESTQHSQHQSGDSVSLRSTNNTQVILDPSVLDHGTEVLQEDSYSLTDSMINDITRTSNHFESNVVSSSESMDQSVPSSIPDKDIEIITSIRNIYYESDSL